ncbi:MAG TPA: dihydrodipicolinate synthase family protein [Propionibacteriaceae bacterium]|nr:dihydrodipicolinate synthase family protein [Propionibacteriaceae bacterium]
MNPRRARNNTRERARTATTTVALPEAGGGWREIELAEPRAWEEQPQGFGKRIAFAAAHVVADPRGENVPGAPAVVDWDATLGFRSHLFRYGLGVAEAMDTAQRNMGLDWPATQELITRSSALAREHGARIASGAGTDQLQGPAGDLSEVTRAYLEQVEFVEGAGSQVIVMASRQLAAVARSAEDYLSVYSEILSQAARPVILHWLGEMFDPQLGGYWGSVDIPTATRTFLDLIAEHSAKVDGVKVSLLSAEHEQELRAVLPSGVRLYTGDDFNYPELIEGDGTHYSDALLGAFAAIAPAAAAALRALDDDDVETFRREMAPTVPLSRHIFATPTFYYKTGIVFLAWLNGHQDGFVMVGGLQSARSILHLARVFELANDARLLTDPELAAYRFGSLLATSGLGR